MPFFPASNNRVKSDTFKPSDLKLKHKDAESVPYAARSVVLDLSNGDSISVISGAGSYSSSDEPYEIWASWEDDIEGYMTAEDVQKIINERLRV